MDILKELEANFIYEFQNMPFFYNHETLMIRYFSTSELEDFIRRGLLEYKGDETSALLYAAILCIKKAVKDAESGNDSYLNLSEEAIANMKALIVDYKNLLSETSKNLSKKLPKIISFIKK